MRVQSRGQTKGVRHQSKLLVKEGATATRCKLDGDERGWYREVEEPLKVRHGLLLELELLLSLLGSGLQ